MPARLRHEASHADYEELRSYVPLPRPVSLEPEGSTKISVMDWLVGVGQQVARRFRR